MAFDATAGGASANSFLSVEDADVYADEHVDNAVWVALTTPQKQRALVTASTDMNGLCLTGTASTATQALAVPRTGWTQYGQAVSTTVVPTTWKRATFEYALHIARAAASRRENDAQVEGLTKLKVGSIELGFKTQEVSATTVTTKNIPDAVRRILPSEWLCDDDQVYFTFNVM